MPTELEAQAPSTGISIPERLQRWAPETRLQARRDFEEKARQSLAEFNSSPDAERLASLLHWIDRDLNEQGQEVQGRFGLAFMGRHAGALKAQVPAVASWLHKLIEADPLGLPALMADALASKDINGAGPTFISLVAYLNHGGDFALWNRRMALGLQVHFGRAFKVRSAEDYRNYNEACQTLLKEFAVPREALDIVLSSLGSDGQEEDEEVESEAEDELFVLDADSFELLSAIALEPTAAFYQAHKADFLEKVQRPLRQLLSRVVQGLPSAVRDGLQTEKNLFSRFTKNDFGKGLAWTHYWGALVPKGRKRTQAPQLLLLLDAKGLKFGFSLSKDCPKDAENLRKSPDLVAHLKGALEAAGAFEGLLLEPGPRADPTMEERLKGWQESLGKEETGLFLRLVPDQLVGMAVEDLVARIQAAFVAVAPLLRVAEEKAAGWPHEPVKPSAGEEPYTAEQCAKAINMPLPEIQGWVKAIERKKQAVFYGPPGTGKTFVSREVAKLLVGQGDGFCELVQFHPAYTYEDFLQGIRPQAREGGSLDYPMVPGRFLKFCKKAKECTGICVLIIDEMNRANLSQVFGELMYCLEYREEATTLAGGESFQIPSNVRILGTMNTADRSIALVDHALRRRFAFLHLPPHYDVLEVVHQDLDFQIQELKTLLKEVNEAIGDENYYIGISYFLGKTLKADFPDIWTTEIVPYLEEFFFQDRKKLEPFRWDHVAPRFPTQ